MEDFTSVWFRLVWFVINIMAALLTGVDTMVSALTYDFRRAFFTLLLMIWTGLTARACWPSKNE